MAIVSCKECKKDMSDKAKYCPHCGVRNSSFEWISDKKQGCLISLLWLVLFLSFLTPPISKDFAISECIEKCSEYATECEEKCFSRTWIDGYSYIFIDIRDWILELKN